MMNDFLISTLHEHEDVQTHVYTPFQPKLAFVNRFFKSAFNTFPSTTLKSASFYCFVLCHKQREFDALNNQTLYSYSSLNVPTVQFVPEHTLAHRVSTG